MMQWAKSLATQYNDMFQALGLTHMVKGKNQLHMFFSEPCINNIPTQVHVEKETFFLLYRAIL